LDYAQRLRRLAINDARFAEEVVRGEGVELAGVDPKTLALARLAALIAVGGAAPSYGAQADAAVDAGATAEEMVDVLACLVPVIGLPRVVAAAPKLALALGYDTDDALEGQSD
jgi:alkylhydroperoxidase/carboxymuconolactone decarboxylase family protein YurZ